MFSFKKLFDKIVLTTFYQETSIKKKCSRSVGHTVYINFVLLKEEQQFFCHIFYVWFGICETTKIFLISNVIVNMITSIGINLRIQK